MAGKSQVIRFMPIELMFLFHSKFILDMVYVTFHYQILDSDNDQLKAEKKKDLPGSIHENPENTLRVKHLIMKILLLIYSDKQNIIPIFGKENKMIQSYFIGNESRYFCKKSGDSHAMQYLYWSVLQGHPITWVSFVKDRNPDKEKVFINGVTTKI